jgi:hypothetical protein
MKVGRRALVFVALAATVPLAILAACGSDTFTSAEDAGTVSAGDGGTPTDATIPSDANADVDAAPLPPTWCQLNAPNAFFCADFDESAVTDGYVNGSLASSLTVQIVDGGYPGIVVAIGDAGESHPGDFLTILPTATTVAGVEQIGRLAEDFPAAGTIKGFQIDFDLRVDSYGSGTSIQVRLALSDVTYPASGGVYSINIGGDSELANAALNVAIGPKPTAGAWTHYHFEVDLAGNVTGSMAGGTLVDAGPSNTLASTNIAHLSLGQENDFFSVPTGGATVRFDNMVISTFDGG